MQLALEKWETISGGKSKVLADRPVLTYYEQVVWETYLTLNTARQVSMNGPQRLLISEMVGYLKEVGLNVEDGMWLMLALENEWFRYYNLHHAPKGKK